MFTTLESAFNQGNLSVKDTSSGRLQPFNRDKLMISLYKSCQHRPSSLNDAAALTNTALGRISQLQQQGIVTDEAIIKVCGDILKHFDKAAATHYGAFHPSLNA